MHTVDQLVDIIDFSQLRIRINISVKCQYNRVELCIEFWHYLQ